MEHENRMTFEELIEYAAGKFIDEELQALHDLKEIDNVQIVRDVTGTPLMPGHPKTCLGNGKFPGFVCCCDECDYMQLCMEHKEFWKE